MTARPDPILDLIRVLGRTLDDTENARIRNGNRIKALIRERGDAHPALTVIQEQLEHTEHLADLELCRAWRKHRDALWAKAQRGVGEKSIARLYAEIGDPCVRADGTERTVAQLWAYCGIGDPARSRIPRGATQEEVFAAGRPRAKKQVWLIATGMLKAGNRAVYDAAREKYAEREWTDGHRHAAALRYVAKCFLKDLWIAARHSANDAQGRNAGGDISQEDM